MPPAPRGSVLAETRHTVRLHLLLRGLGPLRKDVHAGRQDATYVAQCVERMKEFVSNPNFDSEEAMWQADDMLVEALNAEGGYDEQDHSPR